MARKLVVEIVGDASSLNKSYRSAAASTKAFGAEVDKAGRGAAAGSGLFRGLGRSIAFASGSFLAFAGAGEAFRSVIDAGNEATASQQQLAKQLRTSGIAFGDVKDQIDRADLSLSYLSGFTADDLEQSFTTLVRTTGNVNRALKLNQVAADVARGRHISLAQAAVTLAKAESGNLSSLRRLGIEIPKGTSSMEALRIVSQRFAGQAQSGATSTDRFKAEIHNTAAIIGVEVLPAFNHLLDKTSKWLAEMNSSGKTQRDSNLTMQTVKTGAGFLGHALDGLWLGYKKVAKVSYEVGSGAEQLTQKVIGLNNVLKLTGGFARDAGHGLEFLQGAVGTPLKPGPPAGPTGPVGSGKPSKPATAQQRNTWFDQMIARDIDRVQDMPTLKAQIARLRVISALVTQRISVTKDITRKLTLEDTQAQIARQVRADQAQISAKDAAAAQKAADAAKAIAAANKKRLDALTASLKAGQAYTRSFQTLLAKRAQENQFVALGLTKTGEERAPSKGNLQAELRTVQAGLAGTIFDTNPNRNLLARVRKVLGSQFDSLTRETRLKVKELLDALTGDTRGGPATVRSAASISQLIAGTGLHGAALRRLEFNIAGAHFASSGGSHAAATRSLQGLAPVVAQAFAEYPGLKRYASLFAFRQSGPSPKGYGSESYQKGESESFDPSRRAIELFGTKNKPADVAGEIVSHFLVQGVSPALTKLYRAFAKTITPDQMKWLRRDYARGDKETNFATYAKRAGIPALFRGQLFHQLWPNEVHYTRQQEAIFSQVNKALASPVVYVFIDGHEVAKTVETRQAKDRRRRPTQTRGKVQP